jgi:hypothetical protein
LIDPKLLSHLDQRKVPCCLIGAAALAVHGFARQSLDVDLLTMAEEVLDPKFWAGAVPPSEVRRGDPDDPLGGVVRFAGSPPLDLIVGRGHAARHAVESATQMTGAPYKVATPLALVLLKLEAGSLQDRADIVSLVAVQRQLGRAGWLEGIATHLPKLSQEAVAHWKALAPEISKLDGI